MKKVLLSLMFLIMIPVANAGIVSVENADKTITLNDVISIKVIGTEFENPLEGFGLNLKFEESVLELLSVTVDSSIWEFNQQNGEWGAGEVKKIGGASFRGVENIMQFATLEFKAIGLGISDLILSDANNRSVVWTDITEGDIPLEFKNTQIQVIPLPAAIWFMFSGVASLIALGSARKRA